MAFLVLIPTLGIPQPSGKAPRVGLWVPRLQEGLCPLFFFLFGMSAVSSVTEAWLMPTGKIQRTLSEHRLVSSQRSAMCLEIYTHTHKRKPVREKPKGNATTNKQGRFFLHPCRVWVRKKTYCLFIGIWRLRTSKKRKMQWGSSVKEMPFS